MNEKQRKWVKELETTNKLQGRKLLKNIAEGKEFYCCLGIARELFEDDRYKDIKAAVLSDYMTKELGLNNPLGAFEKPYVLNGITFHSLAMMNDEGFSFKEIAAYIKRNPENVFKKA